MYIDDCIVGTLLIFDGGETEPLNLGSGPPCYHRSAGRHRRKHRRSKVEEALQPERAEGVRGRNSDNTLITERLGWAPAIPLEVGLEQTYRWIYDQMAGGLRRAF